MSKDRMEITVKKIIVLFDMDNVLLTPGGYRMAYRDAMRFRLSKGNICDQIPLNGLPEVFESVGVTNEWDMMAITLAILVDQVFAKAGIPKAITDVADCIQWISEQSFAVDAIDFRQEILEIVPFASPGEPVSLSLYKASINGPTNSIFPNLKNLNTLSKEILTHTADVFQSILTRTFQNLILGSEQFEKAYNLKAEIQCDSYLEKFDQTNLSQNDLDWIEVQAKRGKIYPILFTARPSLPPKGIRNLDRFYSPEAEAGARVVGLQTLPLIGMGRVDYMANKNGRKLEEMLKPNSFHAVASIFAANFQDEMKSLEAAYQLCFNNEITFFEEQNLQNAEVHVFEDSPGGVRSVINAIEKLNSFDQQIDLRIWGIADHADKVSALEKLGANVFSDLDSALLVFQKSIGD